MVRIAGARAREIALPMLRLKHHLEAGRAIFGELIGAGGETADLGATEPTLRLRSAQAQATVPTRIDEVVVTYFASLIPTLLTTSSR